MAHKLQALYAGKWWTITESPRGYCQGYLDAMKDYAPRPAYRIIKPDGSLVEQTEERADGFDEYPGFVDTLESKT